MTTLVLTCPEDLTADMVVAQLGAAGRPVVRLDPADLPGPVTITATTVDGCTSGSLGNGYRHLDVDEVTSVWVRRPGRPAQGVQTEQAWVTRECEHALYGTLRALPGVRWMNHPDAVAGARFKAAQLPAAHAAGLLAPPTLITTSPDEAQAFVARWGDGNVVCKSVSGSQPSDLELPTHTVSADADFSRVRQAPTCLQRRVDKTGDIRLTVVGRRMFAARTRGTAALDWRFEPDTRWAPVPVPASVRIGVLALMTRLRLAYGAFDFAVDRDGRWLYLECNPLGQFGFVEISTGQPIARAIAEWLTQPRNAHARPTADAMMP